MHIHRLLVVFLVSFVGLASSQARAKNSSFSKAPVLRNQPQSPPQNRRSSFRPKTEARLRKADEAVGRAEFYRADGKRSIGYRYTFSRLLGGQSFEATLKHVKAKGRPTHVLDLFGSGEFAGKSRYADSVLGVRLGPDQDLVPNKGSQRKEVYGNLLRPRGRVWEDISRHMKKKNITDFSLITMRPEGGLGDLLYVDKKDAVRLYTEMIENAAKLLAPGNGGLFVQVPNYFYFSDTSLGKKIPAILDQLGKRFQVRAPKINGQIYSFSLHRNGKTGIQYLDGAGRPNR